MSHLEPRIHGGIDPAELEAHGVAADAVLDLSVNLNPYGPCEAVRAAAQRALLEHYPEPTGARARATWARTLDSSPECLLVGHGAADLMWAIARALVGVGERVVIGEPTFSELRHACVQLGAQVERVFPQVERACALDLRELARAARGARLVYLCSPNNPTGQAWDAGTLADFARELGTTWLVLDQSFLSMSERAQDLFVRLPPNVICVRSLTKDFVMPGLRIGLALAERGVVERIEAARPSWPSSAPALAAIEAAAGELAFVARSYAELRRERHAMRAVLERAGLACLPSETVFQLVRVGQASAFRLRLLKLGVNVRDASSFGLPEYVRVAVRTPADTARLAAALDQLGAAGSCSPQNP